MVLLSIALSVSPLLASPRTECSRYVQPLPPLARQRDAARISAASNMPTSAARIHLTMAMVGWQLIWATPDNSEEGVWFFKGDRLVDTWGGVSASDAERAGDVTWATKLGVPRALARCFASIELNYEKMQ